MHGITMIFFFIIPMTTGAFGNYLIPLMIGARDMAFPRMNALSFWLFLGSGIFIYTSLAIGGAPNAGWFNYVPLSGATFDPGVNIDFYCLGIMFNSIASTLTAGQFIVTILKSRAPGMSLNRMPLFCYAFLAASFGLLFALPALTADTLFLFLDRNVGTHFFDVAQGGSTLLWQHLFWFFGHPEVYILIVPAFGIATSIIPALTQRRLAAFPLVALAEVLVVLIGFGVWAHHMFATGIPTVTLIFFAAASAIVVIPSTIQVFAWCMSMVFGSPRFKTPLLFIAGFIFMFVTGGLTGIMFVAIPFDQQVTDTYFVVAHFHYIIFGAAVFPIFGGMYYWFPKVTGKLYFERPGQVSFWLIFLGTNLLFFPMHIVGLLGMPRRVYTYPDGLGWEAYNLAETIGGFLTLAGILVLLGNLVVSYRRGAPAGPDPWHGPTLEWTIPSPPPDYDFAVIPKVTSAYPNWDDADREEDRRKLGAGVLVLDQGHEQVAVTPVDGRFDEIVQMPHDSPWPIILAVTVAAVFAALVISNFGVAAVLGILCLLALVGWHSQEPQEA
jgi:heme/copper-type cytochrome/quinol oxidase subunit 1